MKLLLNPWTYLVLLLGCALLVFGGYRWGARATADHFQAATGKTLEQAIVAANKVSVAVDRIGADTTHAIAAAVNDNRGSTDESTERIRTVVVPGDCRAVPADIVRELAAARDDANAALRAGVRPGATGPAAAHP